MKIGIQNFARSVIEDKKNFSNTSKKVWASVGCFEGREELLHGLEIMATWNGEQVPDPAMKHDTIKLSDSCEFGLHR